MWHNAPHPTVDLPEPMDPIYLDHAATTPLRDEVREAMAPYQAGFFGNPSSLHRWGREASAALEDARGRAAESLGARPSEIHFVRGGTESDNLALFGRVRALRSSGASRLRVAFTTVEHPAVREAAVRLAESDGVSLHPVAVSAQGQLDLDALDAALSAGPCVVSVMWVNNEVGMVLPVEAVAQRVREAPAATLHTDAVQAAGKLAVRVDEVPVDLLTVTGHKICGPKGTGLLYVRSGVQVQPMLHGGGQERGLRPGTQDVAGAVGLATALRLAVEEREREAERLGGLRDRLEAAIRAGVPDLRVNAGGAARAPHVSSLGIPEIDGHELLSALDVAGIAASGGSACASGTAKGSHVIAALYGEDDVRATVRFSLGRTTSAAEIDRAAEACVRTVARLRGSGVAA